MCLRVTHIPTDNRAAMIAPCWKLTDYCRIINAEVTPYRRARIGSDGIIVGSDEIIVDHDFNDHGPMNIPSGFSRSCDLLFEGDEIGAGAVHAFTKGEDHSYWNSLSSKNWSFREAYAFNVIAYGQDDDLAAVGVYIPSLDITSLKSKRMDAIKKLLSNKLPYFNEVCLVRKLFWQFDDTVRLSLYQFWGSF